VERDRSQKGDEAVSGARKSIVVTVMVMSGVVAYHFGDSTGLLRTGMGQAFAEEGGGSALPEGIRGFRGMVVGTLVSKGENAFVLKVEKITRVWKQNKAKNPECIVGKEVPIDLWAKSRLAEQHLKTLAELKAGDRVEVEAFHFGGDCLSVVEVLRKAD
jgi:hypothetical protein